MVRVRKCRVCRRPSVLKVCSDCVRVIDNELIREYFADKGRDLLGSKNPLLVEVK